MIESIPPSTRRIRQERHHKTRILGPNLNFAVHTDFAHRRGDVLTVRADRSAPRLAKPLHDTSFTNTVQDKPFTDGVQGKPYAGRVFFPANFVSESLASPFFTAARCRLLSASRRE